MKKLLLVAGAGLVAGAWLGGKNKYDQVQILMKHIRTFATKLRGIDLEGNVFSFLIDVVVQNPTNIALDLPGGTVTLRKIHLYNPSGKKLGEALVNATDLDIPAGGEKKIEGVRVEVPLTESAYQDLSPLLKDMDYLKMKAQVEVLGKTFMVDL